MASLDSHFVPILFYISMVIVDIASLAQNVARFFADLLTSLLQEHSQNQQGRVPLVICVFPSLFLLRSYPRQVCISALQKLPREAGAIQIYG